MYLPSPVLFVVNEIKYCELFFQAAFSLSFGQKVKVKGTRENGGKGQRVRGKTSGRCFKL